MKTNKLLIISLVLVLMFIAVNNRRDITMVMNRLSTLIVSYCLLLSILNFNNIDIGVNIFNNFFFLENYSIVFINLVLLLSILITLIVSNYPRKYDFIKNLSLKTKINNISNKLIINSNGEQFRILEYSLIIIFCITGAIFLISSSDIITVFFSIELQSYSLYLITAIYRNSEYSIAASLMYFLLGSLASCIILLGISLLYINTGSTNLEYIYIINNISTNSNENEINLFGFIIYQNLYIQIAFLILSVGFLFKISAAPFHFWSPDVYDAVPTIVTTFIAIIPKISILILFYNIIYYSLSSTFSWSSNLILSTILSLIIGSILGLTQYKIKRLYAYSTISHIGFILLGLCLNTWESSKAFFFYLIQYSVTNLNAFILLIVIGYSLYMNTDKINIKDSTNSPIQYIYQLKGYFFINPILSISFIITLFSFVGIPPMIGFFAKQMVLNVALNQGYILTTIIAIITSTISAVYYLIIIKNLFFFKTKLNNNNIDINDNNNKIINNVYITEYYSFIISILTLLLITYLMYDQLLLFLIIKI